MRRLALAPASPPPSRLDLVRTELRGMDLPAALARFELTAFDRALKTTASLCPDCVAHVPAIVYTRGGRVLARKRCDAHGLSDAVLENDERYYFLSNKDACGRRFADDRVWDIPAFEAPGVGACCGEGETCGPPTGTDQSTNKTCTVLVEVTDACNLACPVCYSDAKGERKMPLATFQTYLARLVEQKGGLDSVQLTGGEAMLHPEVWEMIAWLHAEPRVKKIYLPTNGILLARPEVADRIARFAPKLMVLLQFDGRDATDRALRDATPGRVRERVVALLAERGVPMQLTMTVVGGVNDDEVGWVVDTAVRHHHVKVVAIQPATYSGRHDVARDPMKRATLSDVVKAVLAQARVRATERDFVPIPCSHPNCGWITLFFRRFGLVHNLVRHVDVKRATREAAYKTLLSTDELRGVVGQGKGPGAGPAKRALAWAGKKLVRSTDVFTIAVKPFMDVYTYDQDRVANCCHHLMTTRGEATSFCEYNAMLRTGDGWDHFPRLAPASGQGA
ncbi:MAG TPA: radical SAM protein [Polyangiaceae bacterium]